MLEPTTQPNNQPTDGPTNRPTNQPNNQEINQSTNQPTNRRPTNQPTKRPANQPTNRPTNKQTNMGVNIPSLAEVIIPIIINEHHICQKSSKYSHFKKPGPANVWPLAWKMTEMINGLYLSAYFQSRRLQLFHKPMHTQHIPHKSLNVKQYYQHSCVLQTQ